LLVNKKFDLSFKPEALNKFASLKKQFTHNFHFTNIQSNHVSESMKSIDSESYSETEESKDSSEFGNYPMIRIEGLNREKSKYLTT
jgi:hypothetical protein